MPNTPPMPSAPPTRQQGVALVLTLIFSILLYILVAELVVSARMLRVTGENDALIARMRNQMDNTLVEIEEQLLSDLAGGAAAGDAGGGLGALPKAGAGSAPGGSDLAGGDSAGGAGGDAPAEDPAAGCDSSRDDWAAPQSRAENDLTTYYWVEPENTKLNLLSLWSPDPKWTEFSRDQLVRLIDSLREDTEFDVSVSDADRIVHEIEEWAHRTGTDRMPRPPLKSDDDKERDLSLPIHLDDLLLLPDITEDLFYDKVLDGKVLRGLESVLTVWTSLQLDPGDPEKNARRAAKKGDPTAAPPVASGGAGNTTGGGANATAADPNAPAPQPIGEGIRINVNFASRPVLRALMPEAAISNQVIDAILRYRNEVDPEEQETADAAANENAGFGDLKLGSDQKHRFFATVDDLDNVEEFANLPDPQVKADFKSYCTTKSDVFSIHLATMFRRNEENRVYVLRRARSVVMRSDDGAEGKLYPIILFEERHGLRVLAPDLQDDLTDLSVRYTEMDSFAQEDRAWNPFLIDFYLPKWQRQQLLKR